MRYSHYIMSSYLSSPLFAYDKSKNLLLKATLPFLIIVHHALNYLPTNELHFIELYGGHIAMFAFFGMSGYGLMHCYRERKNYLNGFLQRSFQKLFVPLIIAFILFLIFRFAQGTSPIDYLCNTHWLGYVSFSWFIFCLACFYLFFFLVFKFVMATDLVKVLIVCCLVFAYVVIVKSQTTLAHHYNRCLSFCVGMIVALYDKKIRSLLVRWHVLVLVLGTVLLIIIVHFAFSIYSITLLSVLVGALVFMLLYLIPPIPETRICNFFSSICFEMYIVQGIAFDFVLQNMGIKSFYAAIPIVLIIDIVLAYLVHKVDRWVLKKISMC